MHSHSGSFNGLEVERLHFVSTLSMIWKAAIKQSNSFGANAIISDRLDLFGYRLAIHSVSKQLKKNRCNVTR